MRSEFNNKNVFVSDSDRFGTTVSLLDSSNGITVAAILTYDSGASGFIDIQVGGFTLTLDPGTVVEWIAPGGADSVNSTTSLSSTPVRVIVTFDPLSGTGGIYMDGALEGTLVSATLGTSAIVLLGFLSGSTRVRIGRVDIWDTVLSSDNMIEYNALLDLEGWP